MSANTPTARIRLTDVSKAYTVQRTSTLAIDRLSLQVDDAEFVCLLGPSGCGKSTVLNLIAGFEKADSGHVAVDGNAVTAPGPERGVVFQQPLLFPWLNVIDNVTFGPRMAGVAPAIYQPKAQRYLDLVGLRGFEQHAPYQLSGGMRQRAALARAWLPEPALLLMDEPFGALDAQTRFMMQELLTSVWQTTRTTVLFVTHDVDEALLLASRVLVMSARPGRIRADLSVPFERPRTLEDLVADARYGRLKREVLQLVREEARKSMMLA